MKRVLYIDFDGTIVDTIKRITDIYNEDYSFYDNFEPVIPSEIKSFNFTELKLTKKQFINQYFTQPRFFDCSLMDMPYAIKTINRLKEEGWKIVIVSKGTKPNLRLKRAWLSNHIQMDEFIGVDINRNNKDHVDMSDGILIDDMSVNLDGSNAYKKICFGEEYEWNKKWKGIRCYTWQDIYNEITKGEEDDEELPEESDD